MRIVLFLFWFCCGNVSAAEISAPGGAGSQLPSWTVDAAGTPWLSWVEPRGDAWVLRGAPVDDAAFGDVTDFASGRDWFINWADTPGLALAGGKLEPYGLIYTHGGRGYALWLGNPEHIVHDDRGAVEHGFFAAAAGWGVWLDGQQYAQMPVTDARTQLRARRIDETGVETVVDGGVCDCCGTSAVAITGGALIAYRDRDAEDVRDINVVRLRDGRFEAPRLVHPDGWVIRGCPVNGPAVATAADRVAVAWFTAAGDQPRVRVALAPQATLEFAPPVDIDAQTPLGRVSIVALDAVVVVVWMRGIDEQYAQIRYAAVDLDGNRVAEGEVARTSANRSSGFPRAARLGNSVWIAFTDVESSRIRVREIQLPLN